MLPFLRGLRRKSGVLIQAALLFIAALTIVAGFRRFSSEPPVAISNKFSGNQALPLTTSQKSSLDPTTSSKSTLLPNTGPSLSNIVSDTASSKSSFAYRPTSSISNQILETASPKTNVVLKTASSTSSIRLEINPPNSTASPETISTTPSPIPETVLAQWNLLSNDMNKTLLERASVYVKAIMAPEDDHFPRLTCPAPSGTRYEYLRHMDLNRDLKYFFALDLHRRAKILPRIIGSIVETIRFLGPEKCAFSIVKGSWDDGTSIILQVLQEELERIGVTYFVNSSGIAQGVSEPLAMRRSLELETLVKHPDRFSTNVTMNMVLEPLTKYPERYATNATVIFLNDVAICMEDILELIHQRIYQSADMTCPMDWTFDQGLEFEPTFHDVWVTRGMAGDSFFDIPADNRTGDHESHLLWNDPSSEKRLYAYQPFQVFSCWSGAAVFTAKPLLEQSIKFRTPAHGECVQGEAQLFCKDLWHLGYGKIATVPSVSIEYSNEAAEKLKALKGYVSHWVNTHGQEDNGQSMQIEWKEDPPSSIKCYQGPWTNQTWVPWDEYLPKAPIEVENHDRGSAGPFSQEELSEKMTNP